MPFSLLFLIFVVFVCVTLVWIIWIELNPLRTGHFWILKLNYHFLRLAFIRKHHYPLIFVFLPPFACWLYDCLFCLEVSFSFLCFFLCLSMSNPNSSLYPSTGQNEVNCKHWFTKFFVYTAWFCWRVFPFATQKLYRWTVKCIIVFMYGVVYLTFAFPCANFAFHEIFWFLCMFYLLFLPNWKFTFCFSLFLILMIFVHVKRHYVV